MAGWPTCTRARFAAAQRAEVLDRRVPPRAYLRRTGAGVDPPVERAHPGRPARPPRRRSPSAVAIRCWPSAVTSPASVARGDTTRRQRRPRAGRRARARGRRALDGRRRGTGRGGVKRPAAWAHPTAAVERGASVGAGTKVWHFCHVMRGARIGDRCVLGQNVFVAASAADRRRLPDAEQRLDLRRRRARRRRVRRPIGGLHQRPEPTRRRRPPRRRRADAASAAAPPSAPTPRSCAA